jgi:hypothetical protein
MASKFESREVKVASKVERVARMNKQLKAIAKKAKKNGGSLGEDIELTNEGLVFTRGSLKEHDTEQGDLYGYLHYGLMKTSLFLEKLPKEGRSKQKYLYRVEV